MHTQPAGTGPTGTPSSGVNIVPANGAATVPAFSLDIAVLPPGATSPGSPIPGVTTGTGGQPPSQPPLTSGGSTTSSTTSSTSAGGSTKGGGSTAPVAGSSPSVTAGGGAGTASATGGGPAKVRNVGTKVRGTKKPIVIGIGSASFSFPSLDKSNKSVNAPKVTFGPAWKAEGKYMVHPNGTKAYPGVQNRISLPVGKGQPVTTPHGKGHKLPDGSVVGIDKAGKPFLLHKDGHLEPLDKGVHTIGGMKIRVFEAATVNVVTPDGRFMRYDSRGNVRLGRGAAARALDAGAAMGGGPVAATTAPKTREEFLQQQLAIAKELLGKLQNGTATEADVAQIQMLLQGLPPAISQILQGLGGLGKDGKFGDLFGKLLGGVGQTGSATQVPGTTPPAAGSSGTSASAGGPSTPPVGGASPAADAPINFATLTSDQLRALRATLAAENAASADPAVTSANKLKIQMIDAVLAAR